MGELILCNTGIAANSYYIEEASLNVYSMEELSFYIYNNAYLLDEGFVNPTLINWISTELDDKRLARELGDFINDKAGLNVVIGHLLRNNGYLTKKEIKSTLDTIASFEGKSEAEAYKIRGDHMMRDNRLSDAIFLYETALDKNLEITEELKGNIYHNLGCALCGLFFFKKSVNAFEQAYRLNRNRESLEQMLIACLFASDDERFRDLSDRYQVLIEEENAIKKKYLDAINGEENKEYIANLTNRLKRASDEKERALVLEDYLTDYKRDYRSLRTV